MLAVMTTVATTATPAIPRPMLAAPKPQAINTLMGSQIMTARVTMMPSSEDEHPLIEVRKGHFVACHLV